MKIESIMKKKSKSEIARLTYVGQAAVVPPSAVALTAFIRQPPLDPLLKKEGKPIIPLYQPARHWSGGEGWILSRLFRTKDGVCQEYWYNRLMVLTAGIYRRGNP
ncbi:MAG: hypothetical protein IID12_05380 [Candidatus Marinimicrobia bacterium]|nr:hypothetical protein [Candidatus Neomarinimicrobiota bacterium]